MRLVVGGVDQEAAASSTALSLARLGEVLKESSNTAHASLPPPPLFVSENKRVSLGQRAGLRRD